jgi:PAS domain S-box-containing protein
LRPGLEKFLERYRAVFDGPLVDGEDRADGHVVVYVRGAFQGVEEQQIFSLGVLVGDGDELLVFLGGQPGDAAGVVGEAPDGQVGEAVELYDLLALDVDVAGAAEDFGPAGPRRFAGHDLAGQGDVVEEVGQGAGGLGVKALLLDDVPLDGHDGGWGARGFGQGAHLWGSASPLFDREGRRSGAIEVIRDVTAQKLAEQALRESERKYRELVENANSIILRWTPDGRISFMNEFGQRFFGYTEAELLGRHVMATIVPDAESGGRNLKPLMDEIGKNPAAFEQNVNKNMRRNGEHVWIAWTNMIIMDQRGSIKPYPTPVPRQKKKITKRNKPRLDRISFRPESRPPVCGRPW